MRISIINPRSSEALRRLILSVPHYEIAWIAHSGQEAIQRCAADKPDLLLMDLLLPGLDGITTTREIMQRSPCPILLMVSSVDQYTGKIFEAMGLGAKDVIAYPDSGNSPQAQHSQQALLRKIRNLERLHRPLKEATSYKAATMPSAAVQPRNTVNLPHLVLLGASTGGPGALAQILGGLPATLKAAVVVVQHMNQEFSFDLATWLNAQTPLTVQLAGVNDRPRQGQVYLAASNDHLILTAEGCFAYNPEPRQLHYRPSVDVFFNSVAQHWPHREIAVLLTGMGRDGAKGLLALRQKDWLTIAQDEDSCVVYGMPKAAKELNAATTVLSLPQIAPAILQSL